MLAWHISPEHMGCLTASSTHQVSALPDAVFALRLSPRQVRCLAAVVSLELHVLFQVVNCASLVSKWVGETSKNLDALFQEAHATGESA